MSAAQRWRERRGRMGGGRGDSTGASSPRLWMHIGLPKTGSSAVQSTFHRSRHALRSVGVDYPDAGEFGGGHVLLAWPLLSAARRRRPDVLSAAGPDEARALWSEVAREVSERGCRDVLISTEYFSEVEPARLAEHAALVSDDVRILVYLRRQDELIESGYVQDVKAGLTTAPFAFQGYTELYDYSVVLRSWSEAFGSDRVVARLYDGVVAAEGAVRDVARVLGVDQQRLSEHESGTNRSTPAPLVELQRVANTWDPASDLVARLADRWAEELQSDSGLLTRAERQRILDAFEASNAEVARTHFGRADGRLFDPVPDRPAADRVVAVSHLVAALVLLSQETSDLRAEVESLRARLDRQQPPDA